MTENAPPPTANLPPPPPTASGAPGFESPQGNGQGNQSHMPPPPLPPVVIPQNTNPIPTAMTSPMSGNMMSPTSAGGYVRRAAPEPNKRALYVGGLDPRCTEEVLKQIFETTGHVQNVKIIPDKNVSAISLFNVLLSGGGNERVGGRPRITRLPSPSAPPPCPKHRPPSACRRARQIPVTWRNLLCSRPLEGVLHFPISLHPLPLLHLPPPRQLLLHLLPLLIIVESYSRKALTTVLLNTTTLSTLNEQWQPSTDVVFMVR
jgi:hypothetical protein